ncbi:hypothetical protein HPP92_009741 [Vanilla planifolia]|uniref:Mediator of RNA polymerase II transcription subunit 13 n=1 Tax=Vanilla planifolia TaxID=51239 RepID=A0A835V517_VANPL|nr:hypothetical protein HPP92_009741 [Vanilla planifolia]
MSSGSNKADGIVTASSFEFDRCLLVEQQQLLVELFKNGSKSEFSVTDANNTGTGGAANVQVGFNWDWDDDDSGIGIDIQALFLNLEILRFFLKVMFSILVSGIPDMIPSKFDVKKKDTLPVRIAGDIDMRMMDASLTAQVGVWRPVVQQAASFVDICLDTDDGDDPYAWLALQEQQRQGFSCSPFMVHADVSDFILKRFDILLGSGVLMCPCVGLIDLIFNLVEQGSVNLTEVVYYAICPEIDLLISVATDFFHQLGNCSECDLATPIILNYAVLVVAVYEACKLGSHTPQNNSGFAEALPGKLSSCGLVPVKCPQELKTSSSNMWSTSSISDYFVTLSKFGMPRISSTPLKGFSFLDSLQALLFLEPDKEKQSFLHSQVAKALVSSAAVDEAAASNVVMLSGFRIPKLVLQIVTVDCLLRLNRPSKELAMYKDIAFTVYNKARRISRTISGADVPQPSAMSGRLQTTLTHVSSFDARYLEGIVLLLESPVQPFREKPS